LKRSISQKEINKENCAEQNKKLDSKDERKDKKGGKDEKKKEKKGKKDKKNKEDDHKKIAKTKAHALVDTMN